MRPLQGLWIILLLGALGSPPARAQQPMSRGEAVFHEAGCENCHTDRDHHGARLAGGRRLATAFGVFYTPNITPDAETGIGRWSEADFVRALRKGVSPEGDNYYPSFPYTSYTHLSDEDLRALWGYLRAQPAVHQADRPHELPWYLRFRPLIGVWKWLYFTPGGYQPDPTKSAQWNRGAYLVEGPGHCAECHTPRNILGGFIKGKALAGTRNGPEGAVVPNITPDEQTGIGSWSQSDLIQYFDDGMRPDGDFAGGPMAEEIDHSLHYLPREDRLAIATYLRSRPAVVNAARRPKKAKQQDDDSDY